MSSLIKFDLGEEANNTIAEVQELFEKYSSLTLGLSAKDFSDKFLDNASLKLKAEVDAMISMVETKILGVINNGADLLYSSLGIDETVITYTRNLISLALHASALASSSLLRGMMELNKYDVNVVPFHAGASAMLIIASFADKFYKKYLEAYQTYFDMIIAFALDPGTAIETLKKYIIDTAIAMAENILDLLTRLYLGLSLAQIKYYCRKGYALYKDYKQKKKEEREAASKKTDEDSVTSVSGSGKSYGVNVNLAVNSAVLKELLTAWLKTLRDSLYSAFCILQVKDAINDIKDAVKRMTDVRLESLAESINSLEDVINMLDEMGLGDDSTSVDLSMIPALGINDMLSSMSSLANTLTLLNEGSLLGNAVASSVVGNASVLTTKTFDISTDVNTRTITVKIYTDPTKRTIASKIYKVFTSATAADGSKLFNSSECKVILDNINSLYAENNTKGSKTLKLTKYNIVLDIDISSTTESTNSNGVLSAQTTQTSSQTQTASLELMTIQEERKSKALQEKANEETRRNTISILHTVFGLIKSVFNPFKELAVLILNYQTNKAYVRGVHYENLITLFQDALKKLGLGLVKKFSGSASSVMYTVRTYALYSYLIDLKIINEMEVTRDISIEHAKKINKWLNVNDSTATKVNEDSASTLYVDYDSINAYLQCLEKLKLLAESVITNKELADAFASCDNVNKNGTFNDLEKVEICEDRIIYSTSSLPRYPSLILSFKSKGYDSGF